MAQSPCSMDNTKKLEPLYSSFFSLCNPHGLHTESRHPQYLSLLGGDNELKEGLIFSPGINLCEIIEHSGQGAKRPDVVLPLLHKVLKHLRRKEEGQEYQIFLLNPELWCSLLELGSHCGSHLSQEQLQQIKTWKAFLWFPPDYQLMPKVEDVWCLLSILIKLLKLFNMLIFTIDFMRDHMLIRRKKKQTNPFILL